MQKLETETEAFFSRAKGMFYRRLPVGSLRRHLSRSVAFKMAF